MHVKFLRLMLAFVVSSALSARAAEPKIAPLDNPALRKHWAFQTPMRPKLPPVKNTKWVRNPIDQFVLARLEQEKKREKRG